MRYVIAMVAVLVFVQLGEAQHHRHHHHGWRPHYSGQQYAWSNGYVYGQQQLATAQAYQAWLYQQQFAAAQAQQAWLLYQQQLYYSQPRVLVVPVQVPVPVPCPCWP